MFQSRVMLCYLLHKTSLVIIAAADDQRERTPPSLPLTKSPSLGDEGGAGRGGVPPRGRRLSHRRPPPSTLLTRQLCDVRHKHRVNDVDNGGTGGDVGGHHLSSGVNQVGERESYA